MHLDPQYMEKILPCVADLQWSPRPLADASYERERADDGQPSQRRRVLPVPAPPSMDDESDKYCRENERRFVFPDKWNR